MKTIQIELPEDVEQQLSSIDENHQHCILEAIREKIKEKESAAAEALKKALKEGYQATYEEDQNLNSDFASADLVKNPEDSSAKIAMASASPPSTANSGTSMQCPGTKPPPVMVLWSSVGFSVLFKFPDNYSFIIIHSSLN